LPRPNKTGNHTGRSQTLMQIFQWQIIIKYLCKDDLITYLLTPWSRVLLEKLTGSQLVKKFLAFYGTRRSITAFNSALHLSQP
jgi:hypothetical protein